METCSVIASFPLLGSKLFAMQRPRARIPSAPILSLLRIVAYEDSSLPSKSPLDINLTPDLGKRDHPF